MVFLRKVYKLNFRTIFVDTESKLVIFDVAQRSGKSFSLVDVNVPCRVGQSDLFRKLENYTCRLYWLEPR